MDDFVPNYQACDPNFVLNKPSYPEDNNVLLRSFAVQVKIVRGSDDYPYDTTIISNFNVARKQLVSELPDSNKIMESMALSSAPYPLFDEEHTLLRDMRTKIIEMT